MENSQKRNSFDAVTLRKIAKGALIAGTGTAGLYLLGWLSTLNYGTVWTPVIAGAIPFLVNAIREYLKGEPISFKSGTYPATVSYGQDNKTQDSKTETRNQ